MKAFTFLATTLLATAAFAVSTSTWTQTSQEDFKKGTLENVVATNLGVLKLSRAVKTLLDQDPRISSVNALAEGPDGVVYAGTGPQGVLLQIKDQKVSTLATIEEATNLTSLVVEPSGRLLVGTAGEKGRVLAIDKPGDKPRTVFESEGVQYVWALCQTPDGNTYAATGPTGKLFEIRPDGSHRLVLDTGESNLLSLASDGKDTLYVGTDPHGRVYRVNRKTGKSFVVYNAAEAEVGSLVLDKAGNLYAVGLNQQLKKSRVHYLHFTDIAQVDPSPVGSRQIRLLGEQHVARQRVQAHRLAALALDEVDDELVDLVAQHLLGQRQRALVGVAAAHDHLRDEAGGFHSLVDRLAPAVHEDRLHSDVVHEDDVVEQGRQRPLVVHDRPAHLHHDHLVVEPLDVRQRFDQRRGLRDSRIHHHVRLRSGKRKGESVGSG